MTDDLATRALRILMDASWYDGNGNLRLDPVSTRALHKLLNLTTRVLYKIETHTALTEEEMEP